MPCKGRPRPASRGRVSAGLARTEDARMLRVDHVINAVPAVVHGQDSLQGVLGVVQRADLLELVSEPMAALLQALPSTRSATPVVASAPG